MIKRGGRRPLRRLVAFALRNNEAASSNFELQGTTEACYSVWSVDDLGVC